MCTPWTHHSTGQVGNCLRKTTIAATKLYHLLHCAIFVCTWWRHSAGCRCSRPACSTACWSRPKDRNKRLELGQRVFFSTIFLGGPDPTQHLYINLKDKKVFSNFLTEKEGQHFHKKLSSVLFVIYNMFFNTKRI